jgi:hypothetical protein
MIDEPPATEEVADDRGQQQIEHEGGHPECNQGVHGLVIPFRLSGYDLREWDRSAECEPVTQGTVSADDSDGMALGGEAAGEVREELAGGRGVRVEELI